MSCTLRIWSRRRWPFWLLVSAWLVANSPQAATWAALDWIEGARSFTHQQRLAQEVAVLLGRARPEASPVIAAIPPGPGRGDAAATLPVGPELKKIELAQSAEQVEIFAAETTRNNPLGTLVPPVGPIYETPTEPPRWS